MSGVKLRRVNHDTSWLVTFPASSEYRTSTFNLLIDPWLDSSEQVDYHSAFSKQKRTSPALCSSIYDLEKILESESKETSSNDDDARQPSRQIDAILISHPFTDHMHPATLQEKRLHYNIPFLVTRDSKSALESLLGGKKRAAEEGRSISLIDKADHECAPDFVVGKEKNKSLRTLPSNVEFLQILPQERFSIWSGVSSIAWAKLHGAVLVLWKPTHLDFGPDQIHTLLYSPHGLRSTSIPTWLRSEKYHHEAILTSLDRITLPNWISGVVNLGLEAVIDAIKQDVYNVKRILATHEERKEAKGLVASLIKRYWLGLQTADAQNDGLAQLKQRDANRQEEAQKIVDGALQKSRLVEVLVLDIDQPLLL